MGALCPDCNRDGIEYDKYFKAARCVYLDCNYFKQMSEEKYNEEFKEEKISYGEKLIANLR